MVRLTFINGFPDGISIELQQIGGVSTMAVSELVSRARILAANRSSLQSLGTVAQSVKGG